jgi:voltage-gated potassium channel Kch
LLLAGDINRPELLRGFHVDHARACVLTLSDMSTTNKAVVKIRKLFPHVPIVARARNPAHQQRLESMFGA